MACAGWPLSEKATVVNAENSRFHASFAVFWAVQSLLDNTPPFSPSAPEPEAEGAFVAPLKSHPISNRYSLLQPTSARSGPFAVGSCAASCPAEGAAVLHPSSTSLKWLLLRHDLAALASDGIAHSVLCGNRMRSHSDRRPGFYPWATTSSRTRSSGTYLPCSWPCWLTRRSCA